MASYPAFTSIGWFAAASVLVCVVSGCSGTEDTAQPMEPISLIPQPVSLERRAGVFELTADSALIAPSDSTELIRLAEYLGALLRPATGFELPVRSAEQSRVSSIFLALDANASELGDEGYTLSIAESGVRLSAAEPAGIFWGIQSMRQLLPARFESGEAMLPPFRLPALELRDRPRYPHRGIMLDVARHFFGVEDVERVIDEMSLYKMNVLHLHLSDDQGFRLEIKSRPELTAVGAATAVGGGAGGFYSQVEYAELVAYAKARYIGILPEIDMPGHTNAALASYAELNCDGVAREPYTGTEVGFSSLCTTKETTYAFVEDVFRELAALTLGPFIHVGGDEARSTKTADYVSFMQRIAMIARSHGKTLVGWDELALAELGSQVTIQFYGQQNNAAMAVNQGSRLILSPANKIYLDMKYDANTPYGMDWAGYIDVDTAYNWVASSVLPPDLPSGAILGVEAPLWTETLSQLDALEYMLFPRLPGVAELGWSQETIHRSFEEYRRRLARHAGRFEALGIDYYRSPVVPWAE